MAPRVSPIEAICARIHSVFEGDVDLKSALEQVARLPVQLTFQNEVRWMRRCRVASFFASSTQQMNSLRARGVMSHHACSAPGLASNASRKSAGSSCTTPPGRGPRSTWPG